MGARTEIFFTIAGKGVISSFLSSLDCSLESNLAGGFDFRQGLDSVAYEPLFRPRVGAPIATTQRLVDICKQSRKERERKGSVRVQT